MSPPKIKIHEPSVLTRVSMQWPPDAPFEDTNTIALNVGGYFVDLRIVPTDQTIQWTRAGERLVLAEDPATFRWTRIIDSFGSTAPDEAHFETLPNGDFAEHGVFPCAHRNNTVQPYIEVWRDATTMSATTAAAAAAWILQSADGAAFLARVGADYLAIRIDASGSVAALRARETQMAWATVFEQQPAGGAPVPGVQQVLDVVQAGWTAGQRVMIGGVEYIVQAFEKRE